MASQYRRRSLMLNTIAKVAQGNPTIITDSSSRRLQKLNVYGQSEQDSTTGANLLNLPTGTFTNEEGQSFKVNDDMTVDVNSPAFESGYHDVIINLETPIDVVQGQTKLRLFFDGSVSSFASFLLIDAEGSSILSIELGTSYTGIASKTGRATKFYYRQLNTGGVIAKGLKFMVSQSSITDYEPYTGGKPSPSPDYPQEIISKEVSEIKVTNGADLSQTITLAEPITLRGIPVDNGGNVTIDGQQYIADYIDSVSGKINRLIGFIESYNEENVGDIYMSTTGELSIGATVIYKLDTPTQEDLPQQDQEAIRALTTYYPNTVIQTGCWNEVTYSAKRGG